MGWFLSSKPKRRKKPVVFKQTSPLAKPWDPQRTLAGLKVLSTIVLSLAFALGWWQLEMALTRYVGSNIGNHITARQVDLIDAPAWMSPAIKHDLQELAAAQMEDNPLDQQGLKTAAMALAQNPWVQEVRQVRRLAVGRLEVHALYRQPTAWVIAPDGFRMVDPQGVVLPGLYLRWQAATIPLPMIRGVSTPPAYPGILWKGADLQAGLALAKLLAGEPYMKQVDAIDVSNHDAHNRVQLTLRTRLGGTVRWGLPPGQEQSIEPPAATKKLWLAQVNRDSGAIDVGGKVVDLFGGAVFIHFPADADNHSRTGYTLAQ